MATTSYIIPDRIIPNVVFLAPFFDEIELVLFESEGEDNLPNEEEIESLRQLSLREGINFNIHLPIDILLGDEKKEIRERGISVIKKIIDRTLSLRPSTYTLHLDLGSKDHVDVKAWKARIIESLKRIVDTGLMESQISIESLDYPLEWIEDVLDHFGFSICLDIGHILLYKQDLKQYFDRYFPRTAILHLHGYKNGVDHLGIDRLSQGELSLILSYLKGYRGIVSLEVFTLEDLTKSLNVLEGKWPKS